jgi:DNA (cytosine-5)-methyltransferase 1
MQYWKLFAPDYGVPQARSRIFLIGVRDDITGSIPAPIPTFASKYRSTEWAIADLRGVTDESVPNQSEYFRAMFAKSGHGQGDEINPRDRPAYTIRANAKSRIQLHYDLPRRLTIRECARLQTFPDTFIFPHPPTTSIAQIGNAVPPLLASVVAAQVSQFLSRTRND